MQVEDFDYELPPELIAHYPPPVRSSSRLLNLNKTTGAVSHCVFAELSHLLQPNDLLVFNNTRVIPARLFGQKSSGGKIEVLVERVLNAQHALVHLRASKAPKPNSTLLLQNVIPVTVIDRQSELFVLEFDPQRTVLEWLNAYGHIPLPPYIERSDEALDKLRYQTIYAKHDGSVAAPTAGLHFDEQVMASLKQRGIDMEFITLHVGAGTFQPVRVQNIHAHTMHAEYSEISATVCEKIHATKKMGGRVIAVGTTTARTLETAAQQGQLIPYKGDTQIFIYPGYQFKCIDGLITNFHLPKSTLLMLVSALAGREQILSAYQTAIKQRYRFFSYGDAMLIV